MGLHFGARVALFGQDEVAEGRCPVRGFKVAFKTLNDLSARGCPLIQARNFNEQLQGVRVCHTLRADWSSSGRLGQNV
jgi:hypothetical protein